MDKLIQAKKRLYKSMRLSQMDSEGLRRVMEEIEAFEKWQEELEGRVPVRSLTRVIGGKSITVQLLETK
jgi:hypothetical protein